MRVRVTKNYLVIKKDGKALNLLGKTGEILKKSKKSTLVAFESGTFPILNEALKKEAK